MFENIFKKSDELDKISKSVYKHKLKVDSIISDIKSCQSFKENYTDILLELCEYLKMYIWKKDKDFLYKFSNIYHCVNFLGLNPKKIHSIVGLSDKDIFEKQNSKIDKNLLNICVLTDNIVKEEKVACDFIEGNFEKNILIVKKIPNIENNIFTGIIGTAQEYTNMTILANYLDTMIKKNTAKCVYGDLDKTFCFKVQNLSVEKKLFEYMIDRRKKNIGA